MKKILTTLIAALLVVATLVGVLAVVANAYASSDRTSSIPDHLNLTPNSLGTITAQGRGLYEANGDRFEIKGINYGNLFIAEGWMTVNSMGAAYNDDGSFVRVNEEGIVEEYDEIYQDEMDATLAERFTLEEIETLNDAFFDA